VNAGPVAIFGNAVGENVWIEVGSPLEDTRVDDTVGMKGGPPNNAEVGPGVGAAVGECIGIEVGSPPANVGMFELVKGPLPLVRLAVGVNVGMHVGLVVGLDD